MTGDPSTPVDAGCGGEGSLPRRWAVRPSWTISGRPVAARALLAGEAAFLQPLVVLPVCGVAGPCPVGLPLQVGRVDAGLSFWGDVHPRGLGRFSLLLGRF